jgi:hypothetical protein
MPNWKKVITSGSDALLNSVTATSNVTITGSLNVSGSTNQIGNNTLLGNTTLTGSIIISGSFGPNTPSASVNIYGNTTHNGYIRFDPVTTNINTSTSASYIYVSGSTNDLYFTQNGSGYSNTTRLRWLEGNMYTGLLSGGVLSTTPGSTTFNLSSGSGIIVTLNATTGSPEPYPTIQYLRWGNFTGQSLTNIATSKVTYISVNSSGTINQSTTPIGYSDPTQWDNQIEIGTILHLSGSVTTGVYNAPQTSYGFAQRTDDFVRAFGPIKISGHILQTSGSTLGLTKSAGVAYNNGANYVTNPNHPSTVSDPAITVSKIYRYYVSGSTPVIDTGVTNAGYTVVDPSKYVVTTTGTLTAAPGGSYTIQRVFWIPNSPTNAFLVYYGNATYNSADTAVAAIPNEPFTEAPNTAQNGILLGYIIAKSNETDLTQAVIVQAGLFRSINGVGASGGQTVVNTLGGLSDVSVATKTTGDLLMFSGSAWYSTKQLTGSYSVTGSLTVNGPIYFASDAAGANGMSFVRNGSNNWTWGTSGIGNVMTIAGNSITLPQVVTTNNGLNVSPGGNSTTIGLSATVGAYPAATIASFTSGSVTALSISGSGMYGTGSFNYQGAITATSFTGSHQGTSSYATQAGTASYVNTLNQSVIITGSLSIGTGSIVAENTLTLGARDATSEGGQLGLNAPGGTYTSASLFDNYQNRTRLLRLSLIHI